MRRDYGEAWRQQPIEHRNANQSINCVQDGDLRRDYGEAWRLHPDVAEPRRRLLLLRDDHPGPFIRKY